MSTPTELWKKWEGRVVDEKIPLRQWLGGSDHSAVFLTERTGGKPQKAAVKLTRAQSQHPEKIDQENRNDDAQLSGWASAAKLSHPHLIRLFECGRCQIDGTELLYVVMEYAEENLAEILPLRPLSPEEASDMLRPAAEALAFLHRTGFVHGGIKPSNIMAIGDRLKISADGIQQAGERADTRAPSAYDAPEVATAGLSPAADIWSLGSALVAVLTQNEPRFASKNSDQGPVAVPEAIPQPIREIARRCLQVDPRQRWTVGDILDWLQPRAVPTPALRTQAPAGVKAVEARAAQERPKKDSLKTNRPKRWVIVPVVVAAVLAVAWIGTRLLTHPPQVPAAEHSASLQPPADVPAAQSPAPFAGKGKPAQKSVAPGSVLQQVLPDVSPSAQNTIEGRLKVSVQVSVDASGNVSEAKLVSPGPSKYFANRALAAARSWKFSPPVVDGQAAASQWMLRFQFKRTSIQVFPAETKP
jgi:TonB family protein